MGTSMFFIFSYHSWWWAEIQYPRIWCLSKLNTKTLQSICEWKLSFWHALKLCHLPRMSNMGFQNWDMQNHPTSKFQPWINKHLIICICIYIYILDVIRLWLLEEYPPKKKCYQGFQSQMTCSLIEQKCNPHISPMGKPVWNSIVKHFNLQYGNSNMWEKSW